jgi:hypothetical protein
MAQVAMAVPLSSRPISHSSHAWLHMALHRLPQAKHLLMPPLPSRRLGGSCALQVRWHREFEVLCRPLVAQLIPAQTRALLGGLTEGGVAGGGATRALCRTHHHRTSHGEPIISETWAGNRTAKPAPPTSSYPSPDKVRGVR